MSSAPADKPQLAAQQAQLPAKRRRGGRRALNPDMSAEERKRMRVLKNRESAMKSLAKKAEYSAKLEQLRQQAVTEHAAACAQLQQLLTVALAMRTHMDKLSHDQLLTIPNLDDVLAQHSKILTDEQTLHDEHTAGGHDSIVAAQPHVL